MLLLAKNGGQKPHVGGSCSLSLPTSMCGDEIIYPKTEETIKCLKVHFVLKCSYCQSNNVML